MRLNAPEYFVDPHFVEALGTRKFRLATWHLDGDPGDYSDLFLVVDHGECGDFACLPAWIADDVLQHLEETGVDYAVVWITNLPR